MERRGIFFRDSRDRQVLLALDAPDDGSHLLPEHKRYLYSATGRYHYFPRHSVCYTKETVIDLVMYGFIWCHDGSARGYVRCVFCDFKIEDFNEAKLAAAEHMKGNPDCPLLKMLANKNVPGDMLIKPGPLPQRHVFIPPDVFSIVKNVKHPLIETSSINLSPLGKIEPEHQREKEFQRSLSLSLPNPGFITHTNDFIRYGFHWVGGDCDLMMCKSCGLYVKNWQRGDLAAVVHNVFSPMCPFMKSLYSIKNTYVQRD